MSGAMIAVVFKENSEFVTVFIPKDGEKPQLTNYLKSGVLF